MTISVDHDIVDGAPLTMRFAERFKKILLARTVLIAVMRRALAACEGWGQHA